MAWIEIYLDVAASGRVMAHLLEPPGLGVRFESRREMHRDLAEIVRKHLEWLESNGETVPDPRTTDIRIKEQPDIVGDFESGDDVGFYSPDAAPVMPACIERYLRLVRYAHADLGELIGGMSDEALDWVRDPRTRSIRNVVRHVVGAELWYMTRIIDDPDESGMPAIVRGADAQIDATDDVLARLTIVEEAFQEFARSLTPVQRSRITSPTWLCRITTERWSARKVLRRCIEHCREHTFSIQRILVAHEAVRQSRDRTM
jgi:hypothetical protein